MFVFFVKKSFFDGWDHLAGLALLNAGFLVALLPLIGAGAAGFPLLATFAFVALSILLFAWYFAFASAVTRKFSDFENFSMGEILPALKAALLPGLQLGAIGMGIALVTGVGLPFYLSRGVLGSLAAGLILWVSLAILVALQYFLPLRSRFGGGFGKNLRKSFIVFADNPAFSLLLFFWSLGTMLISAFLAFLAPGAGGVALAHNDALRLRLRKYDWLESLPQEGEGMVKRRPRIPWKELLAEDDELVGHRTLKGMIFPWKD